MSDTTIIPENTTLIDVYLKNSNGHPLTNTRFIVKPVRAGFSNSYVGMVEDKEELYCTDGNGYVQLHLWPLPYPYMLTYSYDDNAVPGYFIFYVPDIRTVVQLQDLIVAQTANEPTYGERILAQIVAAKAEVSAIANAASVSKDAAGKSATKAHTSEMLSADYATQTDEDRKQVVAIQRALQDILGQMTEAIVKIQGINLQNKLLLGGYQIWVDAQGKLRIKNGTPISDTDGTVVGDQTT